MHNSRYTLPKEERLYLRKDIGELFSGGKVLFTPPFKCVYRVIDAPQAVSERGIVIRFMVSVGKRYHKRAVRRNRVKRLIREAFRLNKHQAIPLLNIPEGKVLDLCYIYLGKEEFSFNDIELAVVKSFSKIGAQCKREG